MSYSNTVDYLYSLQKFGFKFGLENISTLIHSLGNPHTSFRTIHVAGTNGKGSTSHIIASILHSAGLSVGLFTSPHLLSFTERIRVDGVNITENDVIRLAEEIRRVVQHVGNISPTFFEVVTAMAMLNFQRKGVDIAVMEVGMGGRLDATNIILPELSVITPVSFDHQEFLGKSLQEITKEKAGIIKQDIPVVISMQEPASREIFKEIANKNNAECFLYGEHFEGILKSSDSHGILFDYHDETHEMRNLSLSVLGNHQVVNASSAIKTCLALPAHIYPAGNPVTVQDIRRGLHDLILPGRLEYRAGNPALLLDGAHNPAASYQLSHVIKGLFYEKFTRRIFILGIMNDKDIKGIMRPLLPLATDTICTKPTYERAAPPEKLSTIAHALGFFNTHTVECLEEALHIAFSLHKKKNDPVPPSAHMNAILHDSRQPSCSLIVITGSFYTIGEAKEFLGEKSVLSRLREIP